MATSILILIMSICLLLIAISNYRMQKQIDNLEDKFIEREIKQELYNGSFSNALRRVRNEHISKEHNNAN